MLNRKGFCLLFIIIFLFCIVSPVFAETDGGPGGDIGGESYTAGPFEKVLAAPIEGLAFIIEKCFGITPENELIFNHDGSGKKVINGVGPFTEEDWERLVWWYTLSAGFTGVLMFLSFVVTGYRTMVTTAANPSKQADVKSDLLYILMAAFITLSALFLFQILAGLNDGLVDFFYAASADNLGHLPDAMAIETAYSGTLGGALTRLAFIGIRLYLNFLYIIRKFVLAAILILTPFFAFSWATGRNPQAIGVWIGELTSNVFMQAAHAIVLSLYFTMFAKQAETRFWVPIVALSALIPIAEVVRNLLQGFLKWLGVPEERWTGKVLGAMTGMGAVAGLIGLGAASLGSGTGKAVGMMSSGGVASVPHAPGAMTIAGGSSPEGAIGAAGSGMAGTPGSLGIAGGPVKGGGLSVPPGWVESPSGLALPLEHVTPSEEIADKPLPSLESGVNRSQSIGERAARVSGKFGGAVGNMGMPGIGQMVGGLVSMTTGAGVRLAGTTYNAVKGIHEIYRRLGEGATFGDALKQYTGSDSTWKAAAKLTGAVGLSAVGAGHWVAKQSVRSRSIAS